MSILDLFSLTWTYLLVAVNGITEGEFIIGLGVGYVIWLIRRRYRDPS